MRAVLCVHRCQSGVAGLRAPPGPCSAYERTDTMAQNPAPVVRPDATVMLREVTRDTMRAVCHLQVAAEQREYVADNAFSIAQAYFEPKAWFRAIYADETPVGFVMLSDDPDAPEYFLWRLMIDAAQQGK